MSSETKNTLPPNPNPNPLHFLLIPLMAQGHMIPMVDLAKHLTDRGILVTFVTTPVNLARIQPFVTKAAASALPIRFINLPFPAKDAGLPDGCENADLIPSPNLVLTFLKSLSLLRDPLEAHLRLPDPSRWPRPACLIADNLQHWAADIARALTIPRFVFHGPSCFYLFCHMFMNRHKDELEAAIIAETSDGQVMLPDLPHMVWVRKDEVFPAWRSNPDWCKYREDVQSVAESADGVLVNSFDELEPWYFERYRELVGKPVWPVGPLSLYKEEFNEKVTRGRVSCIDNVVLFKWLDEQEIGSVVFVSFGSMARNSAAQLVEIGRGLEASGRAFVWVVKEAVGEWMVEFEKRVNGRGIVIKGWAPQAVILQHEAVGGFMTHCGWNSTLEAVAAGVVMATWPHFSDQFFNERLVVDVVKIGVAVGVKEGTVFGFGEGDEEVVKVRGGEVARAVEALMGGGEEGEERRVRVRELKEKAKIATEEGGSSWEGLAELVNYVAENERKRDGSKPVVDEVVRC